MLKLLRNSLCGLALGLTFADASLAADSERNFDMYLEDDLLGHQSFRVIDDEGVERVMIEASLDYKILFFTFYSYRQSNEERWRDCRLVAIDSSAMKR